MSTRCVVRTCVKILFTCRICEVEKIAGDKNEHAAIVSSAWCYTTTLSAGRVATHLNAVYFPKRER